MPDYLRTRVRAARSAAYVLGMTVALLFILFWLAFANVAGPIARDALPDVVRAQYAAAAAAALPVSSPFLYTFDTPGVLYEAGRASESSSPYFWLSSGAKLIIEDGVGKTQQGALPAYDPWRLMYKSTNALDTNYGYNPENTLRLTMRTRWGDAESLIHFRITATNLTNTPNRSGYSGIFLMGRYQDQHNLYYAGIRQDGAATIKKKVGGTYHTLAQTQIFGKEREYHKWENPNLLPQDRWMGLKMRVENQYDGSVKVQLLLDRENDGSFVSILTATDDGVGGTPLRQSGYVGLRTDYMDVEFENFGVENI